MIIDLHTHTGEHSSCSHQTAEELILRAVEISLDGIVLTDHDYLWTRVELDKVLKRIGDISLVVLRGREVTCSDGHLLVYGVENTIREGKSCLTTANQVRSQGGATILAHPFRWEGFIRDTDAEVVRVFREFDAVEGWTTNHSDPELNRVRRFRGFSGVCLVGASDAHSADRVGAYATRLMESVRTEKELVEVLRLGRVTPVRRAATGQYMPIRDLAR